MSRDQMVFAFDDFIFDEEQCELRKANALLKVDTKLLKLLAYFVKHPGKLVSKQELLAEVWEGRALSNNILSVSVAKLRKALGHRDGEREYIVNTFGVGYRFTPQVKVTKSSTVANGSSVRPGRASVGTGPLVGRDFILQRLDAALEGARSGAGSVAMLAGEPGIGKTRVVQALEESDTTSGARWAWARSHSMESEPPLWLWTQILREYLHTPLADEIRHILEERIIELTRYTDEDNLTAGLAGRASIVGHQAFDDIIQVLKKLSGHQPLVVVLDDLQWADAASLRLLSYLVMEIARWPILVIGTLRTTEFDPKDSHNTHLSYVLGHSNCERLVLNRLTEADVGDYLAALFGDVEVSASRAVYEKSEGNPFFMVELLRPWIHSKNRELRELGFSTFALEIVRQRVRKLEADMREILSAAAVIGRNFDLNLLSYVTQRDEDALRDLLVQPLADNTVVALSEGSGRFSFAHELIREVLYEDLSAAERKLWHLRTGQCLEKRRASGSGLATAELAHHFLSALPHGETVKAVTYANTAAQEAARFFAFADVFALLSRAVQALQTVEHPDLQLLCNLLLYLSMTARAMSDSRHLDYLNQAINIATENGFSRLLAFAAQQLNVLPGIAALPGALRMLETAEKMLPEEDKQQRAMVLAHIAWTPPNCMNTRRVTELLSRAEELARESRSMWALTTVLSGKLFFSGGPADFAAAQSIVAELEQIVRSSPEVWTLPSLNIQLYRLISSMQRGDAQALQDAIDGFGVQARKFKAVELAWHHQRVVIVQRINTGDIEGVSESLAELRERAQGFGLQTGGILSHLDLGVLLSLTSDLRPYAAEFKDRLQINRDDPQNIWASKIGSMVEFGLLNEAESALKRLSVAQLYELPADLNYLATLARLSLGSIATRATQYAEALYQLLKPYPHYYAAGFSLHCEGSVSFFLGMLARTLGRHREAVAHLEEALEHNERFGLKAHVVRTRCELARTLANETSLTSRKRARSQIEHAIKDARKLGLQRLLGEAECLSAKS